MKYSSSSEVLMEQPGIIGRAGHCQNRVSGRRNRLTDEVWEVSRFARKPCQLWAGSMDGWSSSNKRYCWALRGAQRFGASEATRPGDKKGTHGDMKSTFPSPTCKQILLSGFEINHFSSSLKYAASLGQSGSISGMQDFSRPSRPQAVVSTIREC